MLPCFSPVRVAFITGGIVDKFFEFRIGDFERTDVLGGQPHVVRLARSQVIAKKQMAAGNKRELREIRQ